MTAEENKAVVSRYFQEFHDGREHAILEEIMSPDLLEGTRQVTEMLLSAFPDYRITIEEQIAAGRRGARRSCCSPTRASPPARGLSTLPILPFGGCVSTRARDIVINATR